MTLADLRCSIHADLATRSIVAGEELPAQFASCLECEGRWQALRALRDLGGALDWKAPDLNRSSRVRARILDASASPAGVTPRLSLPRRGAVWAMVAASCAAGIVAVATFRRGKVEHAAPPPGEVLLGAVREVGAARFHRIGKAPDEVVRLDEGRVHVEVSHLGPAERFRVVTGDAVVEVRGTAFDVRAAGAHLQEVTVERGRVEVRVGTSPSRALEAGSHWTVDEVAVRPSGTPMPAPSPVRVSHVPRERPHREEGGQTPETPAAVTASSPAEAPRPVALPAAVEVRTAVPVPPGPGTAAAPSPKPPAVAPAAATARVESESRHDREERRAERRELREEHRLERLEHRR